MKSGPKPRPLAERFWSHVHRGRRNECWPWLAAVSDAGYGRMSGGLIAHRVAWTLLRGSIPEGMVPDHFRMNPGPRHAPCSRACCNPAHLELVTLAENKRRGNSPHARHARQTTCLHGHPLEPIGSRPGRYCRTCHNRRNRERRNRHAL